MNKIKGLHINSVNIDGIWVHYNIEAVNGRKEKKYGNGSAEKSDSKME